jgi:DNA polymerase sigma
MDPRIAWHPTELISNAYSTWSNVWMIAQMNIAGGGGGGGSVATNSTSSTASLSTHPSHQSNGHHLLHHSKSLSVNSSNVKSIEIKDCPNKVNSNIKLKNAILTNTSSSSSNNNNDGIHVYHVENLNQFDTDLIYSNLNLSVTSQTILNGLKSRKLNKASTFGFNFPINQHILDDPMSTPWMVFIKLDQISSSNTYNNNNNNNTSKNLLNDDYSLPSSTKSSASSSVPSSPSNHNDADDSSSIDLSNLASYNEDADSLVNNDILLNTNSYNYTIANTNLNNLAFDQNFNNKNYFSEGLVNLHKEIIAFSEYIAPTIEELYMRNEIICRITKVIKEQLPHAEVDVFGSYKTGLFLPTSDIDMVVFGEWKSLPLNLLKEALIRERISDQENVKVLDKASVPIIKILEPKTDLKVDISFNTTNGVKSAELIKKYLIEYPCLRSLVMVLKQFLIQRDFNEVWTGGIGSYSLILMTVSFLQLHTRVDPRSCEVNLGVLLIEFFELYGRCFNYMKTAIRIINGGCYLPKEEILKKISNQGFRSSVLCIEDPLNPLNDIGKGSYGALKVKQAFEYAYFNLSAAVLPQNEFLIKSNSQSILGRIIRVTKEVRDYRHSIKKMFEKKVSLFVFDIAKGSFFKFL